MKIYVGTRNVLKVRATRSAFAKTFPGESVLVESIAVDANVPSQPFAGEILRGAINRARGALGNGDFGVGIEAGLVEFPGSDCPFSVQLCAILDRSGRITTGHGPGYELPKSIVRQLLSGSMMDYAMPRTPSGLPGARVSLNSVSNDGIMAARVGISAAAIGPRESPDVAAPPSCASLYDRR